MKSRDKLKTLHLFHQKGYGHQTCQGSDILQGAPTHNVSCSINKVVL